MNLFSEYRGKLHPIRLNMEAARARWRGGAVDVKIWFMGVVVTWTPKNPIDRKLIQLLQLAPSLVGSIFDCMGIGIYRYWRSNWQPKKKPI